MKYPGKARCLGIFSFNSRYLNSTFYDTYVYPSTNFIGAEYEDNISHEIPEFEDFLRFVMSTDICNLTGMSLNDLLELDFSTYNTLYKIFEEIDKPRRKALSDMQSNLTETSDHTKSALKERLDNVRSKQFSR